MPATPPAPLSRREREIMDIVYRLGGATARQVRDEMPEPPHPAAVRTLLRILEGKGQLRHVADGAAFRYLPTTPRTVAQRTAMRHLLSTFFGGSRAAAVAALLEAAGFDQIQTRHDLAGLDRLTGGWLPRG